MRRFAGVLLLLAVAACDSPEAARARGGGSGADTGNRSSVVLMHEGSRPYFKTPRFIRTDPEPIDGATHAHELSRP